MVLISTHMKNTMPSIPFLGAAPVAVLLLILAGCGNMTRQQQNTAVGAGLGAAAGAVLTGGSVLGTGVGAAVGGVIGNETGK
jgi:osmotically inducible lipoprotein OsmB